jgi:amino acid adenylation domain-containing protein
VGFQSEEVEQSIAQRFTEQVRRYPDRLAVKSREQRLTFRELNEQANRLANALLAWRGGAAEPIALLCGHNARLAASVLGILKARKFYVPLDSSYPLSRNQYILADSEASLLVTDGLNAPLAEQLAGGSRMAGGGRRVLNLDEIDTGFGAGDPAPTILPDDPAYLLYTSGSTGRPKGVLQNQRNVLHNIMKYTNSVCLSPEDRLTLLSSCSYGASVSDIFGALLNGASLFPFELRRDGLGRLAPWLVREQITVYHSVPTVFRHFTDGLAGEEQFPTLRLIKLGGETVSWRDVERYRKCFTRNCVLYVGLGATEMNIIRQQFIDRQTVVEGSVVPVGYGVPDTEVLLLGETGEPVDPGSVGEIAIKSRYLPPGYWRNPELSQAAFQTDPSGERIYRTGDLGRMMPDGCLVHLGRKDSQAKIRGHRVELTEVEMALLALEGIREAVVEPREDPSGELRLVAYLVPEGKPAPAISTLRCSLAQRLPEPMIPSAYLIMEALPLTPNGKVDRLALPLPDGARPDSGVPFVAARTPLEQQLTVIWERVLKVKPVGLKDSFFDLGGHSLLAARLIGEMERALGRELPPRVLVHAPTIGQLAELLRRGIDPQSPSSLTPIQPGGSHPPFFCISNLAGNLVYYGSLAHYLGQEQPVYALDPVHCSNLWRRQIGFSEVKNRIRDTAALYVREIRTLQPKGPYYLGGFCLGATVAFEVAQQLHAQGEKVALLALFEPSSGHLAIPQSTRKKAGHHWQQIVRLGPRSKLVYLQERWSGIAERTAQAAYRVVPGLGSLLPHPLRRAWSFHVEEEKDRQGGRRYRPQIYPGQAALFWSTERPRELYQEVIEAWTGLVAGGIELHDVPGNHLSMVAEPHIRVLADKLNACLERARADEARRSAAGSVVEPAAAGGEAGPP